jgi:putative addiction module killer protein
MYIVKTTSHFERWLHKLRDKGAKAKVLVKLSLIEKGNFGDHKSVGGKVSEIRVSYGPGYRLYYTINKATVVILLIGGDKSSQSSDIRRAKELVKEVEGAYED